MCHGHPRYHPCSHTSLNWYYCPSASIDLETGYENPCRNVSFAPAQSSHLSCPLQHCYFSDKEGSWICCMCNQGPNTRGWCATPIVGGDDDMDSYKQEGQKTCDHGCCDNCLRADPSPSPPPEKRRRDIRKAASKSRKCGHKSSSSQRHCDPPFSLMGGLSLDKPQEESATALPTMSSEQDNPTYKIELDYRSKKPKTSKKSQKSRV
ncbi:hypothetical protein PT974_04563 [Cladobotryum mycophilum]|uniref:Uncharacterized protein n=1 Tax=Cladobotryum mycophilum TaxID=491253 RepID=A0ABR0SWI9_9HYPO